MTFKKKINTFTDEKEKIPSLDQESPCVVLKSYVSISIMHFMTRDVCNVAAADFKQG